MYFKWYIICFLLFFLLLIVLCAVFHSHFVCSLNILLLFYIFFVWIYNLCVSITALNGTIVFSSSRFVFFFFVRCLLVWDVDAACYCCCCCCQTVWTKFWNETMIIITIIINWSLPMCYAHAYCHRFYINAAMLKNSQCWICSQSAEVRAADLFLFFFVLLQ